MTQKFGITNSKEDNFNAWYLEILLQSELIDTYCIRGFIIMRPLSFFIWKQLQIYIDSALAKNNVSEAYFPLLIPQKYLETEKSHIDNFEPEVAWITRSGTNEINPIAVRPTSETIMYPHFKNWLRSYKQLPLKINQWCNVLRWEVKSTLPFIRGREFLWQEGHCCYLKKECCDKEVLFYLNLYEDVYKNLLAVPVIKGRKTESEKFGGAEYTLSVEAFILEAGRAVQAATSHSLGQNFSKMFDIKVDTNENILQNNDKSVTSQKGNSKKKDKKAKSLKEHATKDNKNHINNQKLEGNDLSQLTITKNVEKSLSNSESENRSNIVESLDDSFVFQNSWGFTTRSIGIALMTHSDNKGAVIPPKVAQNQVIIINCGKFTPEINNYIQNILQILLKENIRASFDDRQNLKPGFKYNYHEIRGTPIRFEIGKNELINKTITVFTRNNFKKSEIKFDNLHIDIHNIIEEMHLEMYNVAFKKLRDNIKETNDFEDFKNFVNDNKMVLASWCGLENCEDVIKAKTAIYDSNGDVITTGAKSLCIPFEFMDQKVDNCVVCKSEGKHKVLFGRSY